MRLEPRLLYAVLPLVMAGCAATAPIPDVRGLTEARAHDRLVAAGFTEGPTRYSPSAPGTPGLVTAQMPPANTDAAIGSPVALTLAGPRPTTVPDLRGIDTSAATSAAASASLEVSYAAGVFDSSTPSGVVLSQQPVAGTTVPGGSRVTVTPSKGPSPVRVPDVLGSREASARRTLRAAGFTSTSIAAASAEPSGTVLAQEPGAGRLEPPGSAVRLIVSRGLD